ncbi:MAG: copper amine oxidase N-terminal domain-containing protein [Defluviitaleaceae bacterium]|nr:copper amine oxidase N-terminal domain-containing protein [Defluviitaleaceae bacterium]
MKKFKKIAAIALGGVMTLSALMPAFAYQYDAPEEAYGEYEQAKANSLSFSGEIVDIREYDEIAYITVNHAEGGTMVFVKNHLTFILGEQELEVGQHIAGHYYAGGIAPLIYPPQHTARLIVNNKDAENVRIDRFEVMEGNNHTLMSAGGNFMLVVNENTPIYLQDGQNVRKLLEEGQTVLDFLDGRILVVTYGPTSRAMIPQTIPGSDTQLSVTVLFEKAVHLPGMGLDLGDFELGYLGLADGTEPIFVENYGILVEGRMVDALWRYIDGGFYVPFRAVVNLLRFGHTIGWDAGHITVNNGEADIAFSINSKYFVVGGETITLDHPALLINETTYVPLNFFREVFGVNNAYIHEGQVTINNDDYVMQ